MSFNFFLIAQGSSFSSSLVDPIERIALSSFKQKSGF